MSSDLAGLAARESAPAAPCDRCPAGPRSDCARIPGRVEACEAVARDAGPAPATRVYTAESAVVALHAGERKPLGPLPVVPAGIVGDAVCLACEDWGLGRCAREGCAPCLHPQSERSVVAEARALLSVATPGPWEVTEYRGQNASPGQELAVCALGDPRSYQKPDGTWHGCIIARGMDGPTREPNAALIAAAPRLLAALCDEATALRERAERAEREVRVLKIERPDSEYDDLERIAQERADRAATLHAECARLTVVLDAACTERDALRERAERAESREDGWRASAHTGDEQVLTMRRERDAALARNAGLERVAEAARAWAASEDTDDGTEEDLFVAVLALDAAPAERG